MNKIIYQINKANSSRTMKIFTGKGARTKQRTDYRNFYFSLTRMVKTYTQLRAAIPIFPSLLTNPDSRNHTAVLIDEKMYHLAIEKISLHLQRSLPSNITTLESGPRLLNYTQGNTFQSTNRLTTAISIFRSPKWWRHTSNYEHQFQYSPLYLRTQIQETTQLF